MKKALEKKRYYFVMLRDIEWESSTKKAGSVFCWNSLNSDEFPIVFVGVHQDLDPLDSHFVLKESSRS
jgi:hypothetical protein